LANLTGAKICNCDSQACTNLRAVLEVAGWILGADGLLERKAAPQKQEVS
jgi:hypothetical protein